MKRRLCVFLPPLAALATIAACSDDAANDEAPLAWDGPPAAVTLVENGPSKAQGEAIDRLERASGEPVLFALDPAQRSVTTLYARVPGARSNGPPAGAARAFLRSYSALFGDGIAELEDGEVIEDGHGTVVRLRRTHAGVPVVDDDLTVHFAADGALELVTGHLATDLLSPATPAVTMERAVDAARAALARSDNPPAGTPTAELVYTSTSGASRLAWRVRFADSAAEVRIDAETEVVLLADDGTRHVSPTVVRARGVNGWELPMNVLDTDGGPARYQAVNRLLSQETTQCGDTSAGRCALAAAAEAAGFKPEVASVHAFYAMTADTFRLDLLRTGGPPSPKGVVTVVSGLLPGQASWGNGVILIGSAMGNENLAGAIDVLGHEYTHGLVGRTLNLTYSGQSGAIDESLADVFGLHVKGYACRMGWIPECGAKWVVGDLAGAGGIRDLTNPERRAARAMWDPGCRTPLGSNDNCHVHTNSEIPSYAFYLAYEGGRSPTTNKRVRNALGEDARKIWYRATLDERRPLLRRGTPSFRDLAIATVAAADAIHGRGSEPSKTVACAWDAVDLSPTGRPACGGCAQDGGAAGGVRTRSLDLLDGPAPITCSTTASAATPRAARALTADESVCSVASRGKARWHAFDARAGERTTIRLDGSSADLDLSIYDASGKVVATSSAAGARPEEVTIVLAADARLYARIDAPETLASSARYGVRINGAAPPPVGVVDAEPDDNCTPAPRTCATGEITCGAGQVCTATGTSDRPFCCKRELAITQVCSSDSECPAGQVCGRAVLQSDAGRFFTCSPVGTSACVR